MSSARWCRGPSARGGVLPFCMRKATGTMSKTPSREYRIMHRHLSPSYTPAFASRYCSYKGRVNFHDNWLSLDIVWLIGAGWRKIGFQSFTIEASKYQCVLLLTHLTHHFIGSLKPDTWAVKAVVGWCVTFSPLQRWKVLKKSRDQRQDIIRSSGLGSIRAHFSFLKLVYHT